MHVPDGFIDAPTSIAGGIVAAGLVATSVRRSARHLDDRVAPLAGLTAAYVFAMQMINFPVVSGTSGHLLGGALAAILVGPWVGGLCMTVVFAVQALVFADGGLSALGINVILMGYSTCLVGYAAFCGIRMLLPKTRGAVVAASALASWVGVVAASGLFVLIYAIGGTGDVATGTVAGAMIGVHVLVGIGEGLITALTVAAVTASRPDLVYGARDLVSVPAVPVSAVPVSDVPVSDVPVSDRIEARVDRRLAPHAGADR